MMNSKIVDVQIVDCPKKVARMEYQERDLVAFRDTFPSYVLFLTLAVGPPASTLMLELYCGGVAWSPL
jgi:hypothetical protein